MKGKSKWLLLACTVAIMGVIFCLSAQPGAQSSVLSQKVTAKLQTSTWGRNLSPGWFSVSNLNANVRKWAHVYIYCALGFSMALTVNAFWGTPFLPGAKKWPLPTRHRNAAGIFWAALLCTGYAATDELHQVFVPGRAGMWQDVAIDALGFLPCILLGYAAICFVKWARQAGQAHRQ
ncbi:MAG: VanZ family protein, partial [Gemmiger sp.]|nr:VanZ family protein [Gemmiger sp.]